MDINKFINQQFAMITDLLFDVVKENAASFNCGWAIGYKKSLLDLYKFIQDNHCNHLPSPYFYEQTRKRKCLLCDVELK